MTRQTMDQVLDELDGYTVIVATNNPYACAYNIVPNDDDVAGAMGRAHRFYEERNPEALPIQAMTWDQFFAWEREKMLERAEILESSAEDFMSALEALPPVKWRTRDGVEAFFIGEATHGTWAQQYARCGDRYLTRLADMNDDTTWITKEDFS